MNGRQASPDELRAAISVPSDAPRRKRQFHEIERRLGETTIFRGRWWRYVGLIGVFGAGAGLLWLGLRAADVNGAAKSPEPTAVPSGAGARPDIPLEWTTRRTLSDGSQVLMTATAVLQTRETSPGVQRVSLDGKAHFSVQSVPERDFFVEAGPVVVRVVGTRFVVSRQHDAVTVSVEEGLVEVIHGARTFPLAAGETWSLDPSEAAREVESAPSANEESQRKRAPSSAEPGQRQAEDVWQRAARARSAGDHEAAAIHFDAFARQFPRDPRAKLARLEAARLRQDVLHDPRGALDVLRSPTVDGETATDEPLLARRVKALGDTGQKTECDTARAQYLRKYPNGVHRTQVEKACR